MQLARSELGSEVIDSLLPRFALVKDAKSCLRWALSKASKCFGGAHRFAPQGDKFDLRSVFALRSLVSPSAVLRLVVPIVVDAVYRMTGRALSHVREEILKTPPAVANRDASSAVVVELGRLRIGAPLNHGPPDPMRPRVCHSMAKTSCIRSYGLFLQAPAGFCVSRLQRGLAHANHGTAIASRHHAVDTNSLRGKIRLAGFPNCEAPEFRANVDWLPRHI